MSSSSPDDPEFDNSIERHVLDLVFLRDLPESSIRACVERYGEAGPHLRSMLQEAASKEADDEEFGEGLFRGLHVMAAARDRQAFQPLLLMLRSRCDDVDRLLGDARTETLPRILISTFDGDADALFDAIADQDLDEVVRDSLLRAATFLAWEGRIDRPRLEAFLGRFPTGEVAVDGEFVWHAWVDAIALLGLRTWVPLVAQALERRQIDEFMFEPDEFHACLEQSERDPSDVSRFDGFGLGYLDDAVKALQLFVDADDEDDGYDLNDADFEEPAAPEPVINPWRHVGRNDPCPCGSGKKAKRCCLAA
jgi:Protein of unknown function (DUF1186)/SEC-C motif